MLRSSANTLLISLLLTIFCAGASASTITEADFQHRLDQARSLYYRGSYAAAEQALGELSSEHPGLADLNRSEIEAYRVLCSIAMDRVNAEWALNVFSQQYPTAPELSMIRYALASRYYDNGKYKEAQALFSLINKDYLYREWRTEFEFKRSFCNMRTANYDDAERGFASVIEGKQGVYTYPALFYQGYVKYIKRNFEDAIALFKRSVADSRFRTMSSYYSLECSFMLKDYDTVTEDGPAIYEGVDKELKPKVARILSESFFSLGDRKNAGKYLDLFRKSGKEFSRKDLYFSGVLFYDMKNYNDAIAALRQVTSVPDSISQNAWYLMAGCHLGNRNQIAALNAFKAASELDFDAAVKEKAMFSYAKLSFDVNSDISRFEEYMKAYPSSGRDDEINNYTAASFIQSKDYASAVAALQKVRGKTSESKENLRNAAFLRALQNIDDGSYESAMQMLKISSSAVSKNDAIGCLTDYWTAECLFRTERYQEAVSLYKALLSNSVFQKMPERDLALYNLGYCFFKMGDCGEAGRCFTDYLDSSDEPLMKRDATVRLADSYYSLKNFKEAAELYEDAYAISPSDADLYPVLQGAAAWGASGERQKQIELLSTAVKDNNSSGMYPQVLYELGEACASAGRNQDAKECFLTLRGMKSDSVYYARGLIGLGKINSSEGKTAKAIDNFKAVVSDCPSTPESAEALNCLEDIYQKLNRPDEYLSYIDAMGMSDTKSGADREKMLYLSIERSCKAGNWASAATAAQSFLVNYPDGTYSAKVQLLLARSLASTGRKESALRAYLAAASCGDASLAETATLEYASLAFSMEKYEKAVKSYSSLIMMSQQPEVRQEALSGRMKSSYELKQYDNVITDAQAVGAIPGLAPARQREAQYYLAKSYLKKENRDYAKPILISLSGDCSDEYGAEAAYLLVEDAFNSGNFKDVESRTDTFSDSGTPHLYWLARSFMILGDSYAARGDVAQAESVYRSVKDGYSSEKKDDIMGRIDARLRDLQKRTKEGAE